jgi:hypothetical protein
MRLLNHRKLLVLAGLVVAGAAAGGAFAAFPDTNVDTYTGCLNSGGQIGAVANGLNPLKSCGAGETIVHLGGGDITKVTAGSGLTGGGDNGAVTLSLGSGFQLPQSCATGKIPKWDGSAWQCSDQQTYTSGDGLDLTGNQFSVKSGYQLPQGCNSGQAAVSKGDGTWKCEDSVGGLSVYTVSNGASVDSFYSDATAFAFCNFGDVATGGGFSVTDVDIEDAGPWNNNGWRAKANGGLFGGSFSVYVKCLHVQS